MLQIPITDTAAQKISVSLANQNVRIELYQKTTGLFCHVYVSDSLVVGGVLCLNLNKIVRDAYRGFVGDLFFWDSQGSNDPSHPGLGTRYQLLYLEASEL